MPAETVYVRGLDELVNAFMRTEGALPHDLEMALEGSGRVVKAQVVSNAESTFQSSGTLIGSIDNIVRGPRAYVRVTALRGERAGAPFSYPRMQEYGPRPHGGRPFARKALEQQSDAVVAILEAMVDELGGVWEA